MLNCIIFCVIFVKHVFSKQTYFPLMPSIRRAAVVYGVIHSWHVLLRVKLELGIFGYWWMFFVSCEVASILLFFIWLFFDSCEWPVGTIKWRFPCAFVLYEVSLFIDFVAEKFDPANSTKVVFGQKFFEQFLSFFRNLVLLQRKNDFIAIYCIYEHGYWFGLIWTDSKQHFIKYNSQRPNISLHRIIFASQYLRSHVNRRAEHSFSHILPRLEPFAKAEIPQFDLAIWKKYVLRLDIPMHNIKPIQHFKGLHQLPKNR